MKKLFTVLAVLLAVLGLILTILPTEKLGLIPVILSIVFSALAVKRSTLNSSKFTKGVLVFTVVLAIVAVAKIALTKDEIVIDQRDEVIKIESQKEDQKDLEALDEL